MRGRPVSAGASATLEVKMLVLQREIGNAAVGRLVRSGRLGPDAARQAGRPRRGRTLARFIGIEHEQLGNEATGSQAVDIGGIRLTWGQIIALAGDQISSIDELLAYGSSAPAKRRRLRAAFDKDELKSVPPELTEEASKADKEDQDREYLDLAMRNVTHFPDQGKAIGEWTRHHRTALDKAVEAGVHSGTRDLAYAWEAFGEHFLTDCFSGGHIRTPRATIIDWYRACFGARALAGLKSFIVAGIVSQLPPTSAAIAGAVILASFVPAIDAELREQLALIGAGAVSGAMHDQEGDQGVWVRSKAHPSVWKAYGDGKLNYTPQPGDDPNEHPGENKNEAEKAIRRAKSEVDKAFDAGRDAAARWGASDLAEWIAKTSLPQSQIEPPYQRVLDFVPEPLPVGPTGNKPLPEWRWGSISDPFIPKVDDWIRHYAGKQLDDLPNKVPEVVLIPDPIFGSRVVFPRAFVRALTTQLKAHPVDTLGRVIGWPAAPSLAHGSPSPPLQGPCAVPPLPPPPPPTPHHHVVTLPEEVLHFDFDSATVQSEDKARVIGELEKELGPGLSKIDLDKPVEVRGHTDSIGSNAYNQALSQRRAEAVKAVLEERYPKLKGHLTTIGYGSTRPVAPNRKDGHDNPAGRRLNRRVEVVVEEDVPD